jgi:putative ABC transport system ATP-binding protein
VRGDAVVSTMNVTREFQSGDTVVRALVGVTTEFFAGELCGIFGPSGCGKTTLLMMLGLLDEPTTGTVFFGGAAATDMLRGGGEIRDYRRKHIGFVFQKANLIPFLTAVENVALSLVINDVAIGPARARARELLAALDIAHRCDNYPTQLSGGEQQRVSVARALANNPSLILADEPTAALDSRRGRQVMELLKRVAADWRAAVAVVTHDPRSVDLFDRILEMNDGRVVAERAASSVPMQPLSPH